MHNAILIIPFVVGLAPGVYLARQGKALALVLFIAFVATITFWAMLGARGGQGAEAMLHLFLIKMLSPVVIGLGTGGLIGLYLGRKAGHIRQDDHARAVEPV